MSGWLFLGFVWLLGAAMAYMILTTVDGDQMNNKTPDEHFEDCMIEALKNVVRKQEMNALIEAEWEIEKTYIGNGRNIDLKVLDIDKNTGRISVLVEKNEERNDLSAFKVNEIYVLNYSDDGVWTMEHPTNNNPFLEIFVGEDYGGGVNIGN